MNCRETRNRLDDYFDRCSPLVERAAVEAHTRSCPACAAAMAWERDLRERLRGLPAPEPDMARFEGAIAAAADAEDLRRRHHRWRLAGGALAASLVLAVALNLQPAATESAIEETAQAVATTASPAPVHEPAPAPPAPVSASIAAPAAVTLSLHEEREISLALESQHRVKGATFTVVLPEGLELSGHPGLREVSWIGNLESGQNFLVLPLRAQAGSGGEIVAHIAHVEQRQSLRLQTEVVAPEEKAPAEAPAELIAVM